MTITAKGHWSGDPTQNCARLTAETDKQSDAKKLARLFRVMSDPQLRERLFELCDRLEEEASEAAELVGC